MFTNVDIRGVARGPCKRQECECDSFTRSCSEAPVGASGVAQWGWCCYCGHPPVCHTRIERKVFDSGDVLPVSQHSAQPPLPDPPAHHELAPQFEAAPHKAVISVVSCNEETPESVLPENEEQEKSTLPADKGRPEEHIFGLKRKHLDEDDSDFNITTSETSDLQHKSKNLDDDNRELKKRLIIEEPPSTSDENVAKKPSNTVEDGTQNDAERAQTAHDSQKEQHQWQLAAEQDWCDSQARLPSFYKVDSPAQANRRIKDLEKQVISLEEKLTQERRRNQDLEELALNGFEKMQEMLEKMQHQLRKNIQSQTTCSSTMSTKGISKPDGSCGCDEETMEPDEAVIPAEPQAATSHSPTKTPRSLDLESPLPTVQASPREGDKVKLGPGVVIEKEQWQELVEVPRDSLFVRQMARALWGIENLRNRSVTGAPCRRYINQVGDTPPPAKRALSPVKLRALKNAFELYMDQHSASVPRQVRRRHVNRCLAEMLNDLSRTRQ